VSLRHSFVIVAVAALVAATGCAGTSRGRATHDGRACRPHPPGTSHIDLAVGGRTRTATLSQPRGPGRRALVLDLHGFASSGRRHDDDNGMARAAARRGMAVVTPDALGTPSRWNFDRRPGEADDDAFVDALVRRVSADGCIDADRIFVAGSSNGAAFAGLLACTPPFRFAAVAMVIATVPDRCPPERTPAAITIRGTADPAVPFAGADALLRTWAEHNGCDRSLESLDVAAGVTETRFAGCRSPAALVAIAGGVHTWPGGARADKPGNSEADIAYSATDRILDFFTAVGRQSATIG
jgi:polyhydroxybutyrate depolymerase